MIYGACKGESNDMYKCRRKTLKIKKDKFISCFKKLPDGGSITGYVTFRRKYLLSGENISNLSDSSFIQVENTNYAVKNKKGCTKK